MPLPDAEVFEAIKAHPSCLPTGWAYKDLKLRDLTEHVTFDGSSGPLIRGESANVYRGKHEGRLVALKVHRYLRGVLEHDTLRRFWREAENWNKLTHKNIVKLLGVVHRDKVAYLVSSWAVHGTVLQYIKEYPSVIRYPIIHGIVSALAYLHEKRIVHGDLKGSNILVDGEGTPMLSDFGLSKVFGDKTSSAIAGSGSIQWCAPELFNEQPKTMFSDMYAVGLVIFEVLAAESPFSELAGPAGVGVLILSVIHGKRPNCVPVESIVGEPFEPYWGIARDAWNHEPSDRPNVRQVLSRLDDIGPPQIIMSVPSPSPPSSISSPPDSETGGDFDQATSVSGKMYLHSPGWHIFSSATPVRYWFSILDTHLNYYLIEDDTQQQLVGFIELPRCVAIKQIVEYPFGFGFSLIGKSCRRYVFSVETLEAAQAWTQAITKAMISVQPNSSRPFPRAYERKRKRSIFWCGPWAD